MQVMFLGNTMFQGQAIIAVDNISYQIDSSCSFFPERAKSLDQPRLFLRLFRFSFLVPAASAGSTETQTTSSLLSTISAATSKAGGLHNRHSPTSRWKSSFLWQGQNCAIQTGSLLKCYCNLPLGLSQLISLYTPSRSLRSASQSFLAVPGPKDCKTKQYGQRAFRYIAIVPSQWMWTAQEHRGDRLYLFFPVHSQDAPLSYLVMVLPTCLYCVWLVTCEWRVCMYVCVCMCVRAFRARLFYGAF